MRPEMSILGLKNITVWLAEKLVFSLKRRKLILFGGRQKYLKPHFWALLCLCCFAKWSQSITLSARLDHIKWNGSRMLRPQASRGSNGEDRLSSTCLAGVLRHLPLCNRYSIYPESPMVMVLVSLIMVSIYTFLSGVQTREGQGENKGHGFTTR